MDPLAFSEAASAFIATQGNFLPARGGWSVSCPSTTTRTERATPQAGWLQALWAITFPSQSLRAPNARFIGSILERLPSITSRGSQCERSHILLQAWPIGTALPLSVA